MPGAFWVSLSHMTATRRFEYRGIASVLSGHVAAPADASLDAGCASALPVNGGLSRAKIGRRTFGGVVTLAAASTHAQGDTRPARRSPARSRKAGAEAPSQAHVGADVRGLRVGGGAVRLTATRVRAELTALCAPDAEQPSIGAMDGALFQGMAFGRYPFQVTIDRAFFRQYDTHAKLRAAASALPGSGGPHAARAAAAAGTPQAPAVLNIVKRIRWTTRPFPKATIDDNVVTIPGFGRVFFGELIVTGGTRRLTMLRFELDGAVALHGACCEVEAGGTWRP